MWVHREPVDMRKSFDTLAAIVRVNMKSDLLLGEVFVFVGRRRRHAKALWWDGTGLVVHAKRLARIRFSAPWERRGSGPLRWTLSELSLFLEGSEVVGRIQLSPPPTDVEGSRVVFA
ncbi:MAG TPA: IS66 family insertion sequence element accessory protein TnpB [Acidimicrobiia bacterium]|nr:IS66 family insertion sequence element accessory protein TnpB [Acidimicrobiia bacterium]